MRKVKPGRYNQSGFAAAREWQWHPDPDT